MYCSRCGARSDDGAAFCASCGAPLPAPGSAPGVAPMPAAAVGTPPGGTGPPVVATKLLYGGFWRRLWAMAIDRFLIGAVTGPFFGVAFFHTLMSLDLRGEPDPDQMLQLVGAFLSLAAAMAAVGWLYFALMESSAKQATLGKLVLGVRVTDLSGNRIGFGRASGRFFGKILSGLILGIGYLMAAFTERKQGLHDLIAGTLVLRRGSPS